MHFKKLCVTSFQKVLSGAQINDTVPVIKAAVRHFLNINCNRNMVQNIVERDRQRFL